MSLTRPERLDAALALRFAAQGGSRFARFVSWVSFVGLTLGVMVLTVVITVMNGFDGELKSRLLRSIPHVTIADATAGTSAARIAREMPDVVSVHEYFQGVGAISASGDVQPIGLYGIGRDGVEGMQYLAENMMEGALEELPAHTDGILLGAPLARYLRLRPGDPVVVLAIANAEQGVSPQLLRFTLRGTFELGAEPDYNLAIVNLSRQERDAWSRMGDVGLQVQLEDPLTAGEVQRQLDAALSDAEVDSWSTTYGELFQAVRLEKSMMFLLLLLVVAIASFNIIAGQTMMVNDKRAAIAILRTMGASQRLVRSVFLAQGIFVGVVGTGAGLCLGLLAAFNINGILDALQAVTGMHLLDGSFFVEVPVLVLPQDLLVIAALSCGLCLLSAWFPARRAANLDPVQSLH